jgi:hypothetical protein
MGFFDFLFGSEGTGPSVKMVSPYSESQRGLMDLLGSLSTEQLPEAYNYLSSFFQGLPDEYYRQVEQPARSSFMKETVPTLAERFAGMNALSSSGFEKTLAKAARGLEEQLAAQRAQSMFQARGQGLGALGQLGNFTGLGLKPQYQPVMMPGSQGSSGLFGSPLMGVMGNALGGLFL